QPVGPELPLKRQIPRVNVQCLHVRLLGEKQSPRCKRRILVQAVRKRASAIVSPWSVQTTAGLRERRASAPGIGSGGVLAPYTGHESVPVGIRRAKRCSAIAFHIPCESDARRKMPPLLVDAGLVWKTGITREIESGWSVFEHTAINALDESIVIEVV